MKKILLMALGILFTSATFSQTNTFPTTGNVGIGTTSPSYKLHTLGEIYSLHGFKVGETNQITADALFNGYKSSTSTGAVYGLKVFRYLSQSTANTGGIYGLHVLSGPSFTSSAQNVYGIFTRAQTFGAGTATNAYSLYSDSPTGSVTHAYNIYASGGADNFFGGNVGIGTTSPTEKLDVRGNIKVINTGSARSIVSLFAQGTAEAGIYFDASNGDGVGSDYGGLKQRDDLHVELSNYGANPIHFRTAGADRLTVLGNGNVGVGTTSPSYKLHVNGNTFTHGLNSSTAIHIYSPQAGNTSKRVTINTLVGNNAYIYNYDEVAQTFHSINFGGSHSLNSGITVHGNGNVSIGAANMGEKLEVNGTIRSKKVKVDANGWPDYVFANDYKLRSLLELEAFIKDNHHLPEVPSAEKIEKEGLDLGSIDATLLKKVEELTLYMIEMKKEIEVLKEENKKLSDEVKKVKK